MTVTVTDLFCGAGGSSLGAETVEGVRLEMAANHWATAIDVHQTHFPHARHDLADISQADPRRYPRTDILLASPECTYHSQARGVSRRQQDITLFDTPDAAADRSRATMWDVGRFAEQKHYDCIVVENVVEATKWTGWTHWLGWLTSLGYDHRVLSHNSMFHGVPQSRDRIYVVFWRRGIRPDLELEVDGWCVRCDRWQPSRQAWRNERTVGRYRQQWHWACTVCGRETTAVTEPAAKIIDWSLDCPRIGDRVRPLADKTRARILAGLQRYGWVPVVTAGAGHVWEATPGMRARALTAPLPTQHTSSVTALATPPGFLVQTARGKGPSGRVHRIDVPHPSVCASDDRLSLIVPLRRNGDPQTTNRPVPTITAGGNHHGLLMRNNDGGPEMVTPLNEPARTITTKGHQSLLMPYYGNGACQPVERPAPTVTTRDRCAIVDPERAVDDCGFRMLEPHEIAAAMAFPDGYIPAELSKKDRVKLAGNAVTPPAMAWIVGRVARALEDVS